MSFLSLEQPTQNPVDDLASDHQAPNYRQAEQQFLQLLSSENLDWQVINQPNKTQKLEKAIETALAIAFKGDVNEAALENWFLQRILYQINRLNFFWYGDLQQYTNERSPYLQWIRDRIESVWQAWELAQLNIEQIRQADIKQALKQRAQADLNPPLSENQQYIRQDMTLEGYRHLIAIASLDGLVESSRLCNILGGASHEVQATLMRVLIEEYGGGRLARKHSTFFALMMQELGLDPQPEAYLDWVPWQVLACINHNFLLTERKRHYLRYNGGFTYFEIVGPSVYKNYMTASQRLGLSDTAMGYWELHIREDERHGQWMLNNVALPLVDNYPDDAWEILLGYDQDKLMGDRASQAVIDAVKAIEQPKGS
jgi:hypothetical protein